MFWTKIKRISHTGFYSFWRNGFVSISLVLVMVITLSVIAGTIILGAIYKTGLQEIKNKVDVNIYFVQDAKEDDILALKKTIEVLPEVQNVTYTSAGQALSDFKTKHQNDQITLQALDEIGHNPFGATLNIKAKDPSQYEGIVNFLGLKGTDCRYFESKYSNVDKVNYCQNKPAIDNLTRLINSADRLGFALTIFLIAISILITYNTIRLSIFMSKDEISVMRLVGASTMYIRGPFVISGIIYGLVSGIITLILVYLGTFWISQQPRGLYEFYGIHLFFEYYIANFGQIFLIILGSGVFLGAFSSYLAARKHLRV